MRRVAITGVAGLLGSHLADKFISEGFQVIGVDNLIGGEKSNIPDAVMFHEVDCADFSSMEKILSGVDTVIHAACTAYEGLSVFSPALVSQNTAQASIATISAAISNGVKKFVYCSSMARYGEQDTFPYTEKMIPNPQDPYGISKVSGELTLKNLCETHGMEYVIIVPHNIIGSRQKYDDPYRNVASIMINRMLQNMQPIIYGDGSQSRCFTFVQDVVEPIYNCATSDIANSRVINIGPDDEFISINELAHIIAEILEFELDPIYVEARPREIKHANCSADLARELLGYAPKVGLKQGLSELADWIKINGTKPFNYHLPLEIVSEITPKTWTNKLF